MRWRCCNATPRADLSLAVYDPAGRLVRTILEGNLDTGRYAVTLDLSLGSCTHVTPRRDDGRTERSPFRQTADRDGTITRKVVMVRWVSLAPATNGSRSRRGGTRRAHAASNPTPLSAGRRPPFPGLSHHESPQCVPFCHCKAVN